MWWLGFGWRCWCMAQATTDLRCTPSVRRPQVSYGICFVAREMNQNGACFV